MYAPGSDFLFSTPLVPLPNQDAFQFLGVSENENTNTTWPSSLTREQSLLAETAFGFELPPLTVDPSSHVPPPPPPPPAAALPLPSSSSGSATMTMTMTAMMDASGRGSGSSRALSLHRSSSSSEASSPIDSSFVCTNNNDHASSSGQESPDHNHSHHLASTNEPQDIQGRPNRKRRIRSRPEIEKRQAAERNRRAQLSEAVADLRVLLGLGKRGQVESHDTSATSVVRKAVQTIRSFNSQRSQAPDDTSVSHKQANKRVHVSVPSNSNSMKKSNSCDIDFTNALTAPIFRQFSSLSDLGISAFRVRGDPKKAFFVDVNSQFEADAGFHRSAIVGCNVHAFPLHSSIFSVPSIRALTEYRSKLERGSFSSESELSSSSLSHPSSLSASNSSPPSWDSDIDSPTCRAILNQESCTDNPYPVPLNLLQEMPPDEMMPLASSDCSAISGKWKSVCPPVQSPDGCPNKPVVPLFFRCHTVFNDILEMIVMCIPESDNDNIIVSTRQMRRKVKPTMPCINTAPAHLLLHERHDQTHHRPQLAH